MHQEESFCNPIYKGQIEMAERELFPFHQSRPSRNSGGGLNRYEGISNTIVQLTRIRASGVIRASPN